MPTTTGLPHDSSSPDNGTPAHDVGVQAYGGSGNSTPVGIAEDDAGLLISFDAGMYMDITLSFDWRTFSAGAHDQLVVGYFVGDITSGHPTGFVDGQIDLRPTDHGGPGDGDWNWEGGGWIELLRVGPSNSFSTEVLQSDRSCRLLQKSGWRSGLTVANMISPRSTISWSQATLVPLPAAVWLMGSGLLALAGLRRRS